MHQSIVMTSHAIIHPSIIHAPWPTACPIYSMCPLLYSTSVLAPPLYSTWPPLDSTSILNLYISPVLLHLYHHPPLYFTCICHPPYIHVPPMHLHHYTLCTSTSILYLCMPPTLYTCTTHAPPPLYSMHLHLYTLPVYATHPIYMYHPCTSTYHYTLCTSTSILYLYMPPTSALYIPPLYPEFASTNDYKNACVCNARTEDKHYSDHNNDSMHIL